jgi:hypothetical protein
MTGGLAAVGCRSPVDGPRWCAITCYQLVSRSQRLEEAKAATVADLAAMGV